MFKNPFMLAALEEARCAFDKDEVPIGCIITLDNQIIARGHNLRETKQNVLCHAEIMAIEAACNVVQDWRLDGCDIYVTLEPCMMCAGAILNARFRRLYFGAWDLPAGGVEFLEQRQSGLEIYGGICEEECKTLLDQFFNKIRKER